MPDDEGALVVGTLKDDGAGFETMVVEVLVAVGISNDDKNGVEIMRRVMGRSKVGVGWETG